MRFYDCSNLTDISIPNSLTTIGESAFSFCKGLTKVSIPNSVKSINRIAFSCCTSLTDIFIPNSVTTIGVAAFLECYNLRSIRIPNSITSIGARAFKGCSNLQNVIVEDIVAWCNISFDDNPIWYAHHIYNEENEEITELTKYNYDSNYGIVDNKYELDLEDDAAYMNSNGNLRMPSSAQFSHLVNNTIEEEITFDGVVGSRLASKKNGNYIFMPYSGVKTKYSYLGLNDAFKYWTRTLAPDSDEFKGLRALAIGSAYCYYPRYYGLPVRPVEYKDSGLNVETKIKEHNMTNSKYYTLDGRMLNGKPTQQGIYITNGRKFVIK